MSSKSSSRPRLSVPSRWPCWPGARKTSMRWLCPGLNGKTMGPRIAATAEIDVTASPTTALRCVATRRPAADGRTLAAISGARAGAPSASGVMNAGVDICIKQVNEQVDDDECGAEHQHEALHDGVGAEKDRVDEEPANSRPGEDRLRHHGAAQQRAELQSDHRHDRKQCIAERVAKDH